MFSGLISEELRASAFQPAPPTDNIWIGDVLGIPVQRELVPIRFYGCDYWVMFANPVDEAGGADNFELLAPGFCESFVPDPNSRIVKFFRTDAGSNHFKPHFWTLPLSNKFSSIFQFLEAVGGAVYLHSETLPEMRQYFYLPADGRLERIYRGRVFRSLDRACLNGRFVPYWKHLENFVAIKERNQLDPNMLALKQASAVRMLMAAQSAQRNGTLKVLSRPSGIVLPVLRRANAQPC